MKGKIKERTKPNGEKDFIIEYYEDMTVYNLDINPRNIAEAKKYIHIEGGVEIDFFIDNIGEFPYRWANIIVDNDLRPTSTIADAPPKTPKKKYYIGIAGSSYYDEIVCHDATSSSSGFYTFYDLDEKGIRVDVAYYPIAVTMIHKIEYNVTE